MVGGYLTYQGIEGKARYAGTAIEDIQPVTLSHYDNVRKIHKEICPK